MDHDDHVRLIRDGVEGAGRRWLELGAGRGAFTLALADLLGPGGEIVAVDRNAGDLRQLASTMAARFPATRLRTVNADFTAPMSTDGPRFDGLLAANALHFVRDPAAVIDRLRLLLRPAARVIVVEYDSDSGNPWVPHPLSYARWEALAAAAGLAATRLIGRVPSRFLEAIYAAASEMPAAATPQGNEEVGPGRPEPMNGSDPGLNLAARRSSPRPPTSPCYTPGLTARTGRSNASTAMERARDGASRAGPAA